MTTPRLAPVRAERRYALAISLCALALVGMKGEPFRYARDVQASAGWTVLELPDEVLALARPGLADVRLETPSGELGYVLEETLAPVVRAVDFHNVESTPGRETTALLDRGTSPARCNALTLEIADSTPFLKPLVLEASADGKEFQELARASIFRVDGGFGLTRVAFAANDRRFLRVRLDDKNGAPIRPVLGRCAEMSAPEAPLRDVAVALERTASATTDSDAFVLRLPSANLPVVELKFTIRGLAFAREVKVYERVLFRDELSRILVGSGKLERSATGTESTRVALGELRGSVLEVDIERSGAELDVTAVGALVRPKRLVFITPDQPGLTLRYGSADAVSPRYDLGDALGRGRPATLGPATLGPVRDSRTTIKLPPPARAAFDAAAWKRRARIVLPAQGSVAYLDLEGAAARDTRSVRIRDAAGRQVPYIVEKEPRLVERTLGMTQRSDGTTTRLSLSGLNPAEGVVGIELYASAPRYFERSVTLFAEVKDRRGVTGRNQLGSGNWRKQPDTPDAVLRIPVLLEGQSAIEAEIPDGDNPPITLSKAAARGVRRRVDFLFEPGERLELLWDNANVAAPRYDLAVIASAVLESPALAASLEKAAAPAKPPEPEPGTPKWFWWVVVGSGMFVVLALFGVRRKS